MDWRHNVVKYFTIATLLFVVVVFITPTKYAVYLPVIMYVLSLVSLYALYTYVADLDKMQCACAVKGMYWTHTYLYYWRYLLVLLTITAGIILINANTLANQKEHNLLYNIKKILGLQTKRNITYYRWE
jgi:hypothetical protein